MQLTKGCIQPEKQGYRKTTAKNQVANSRAQVVSWVDTRVVEFCSTGARYQLGVSTSIAAFDAYEVSEALAQGDAPVLVDIVGFESTLPSGWAPAPDVAGVLSLGRIRYVGPGECAPDHAAAQPAAQQGVAAASQGPRPNRAVVPSGV